MIVLDSSVALKWIFADEDGAERAVRVRDEHVSGTNEIAVPSLFFYEIANVLSTKVKLSPEEALEAFELISAFELNVHEPDSHEYL
jgi:predicted nucleic acid-binding protein